MGNVKCFLIISDPIALKLRFKLNNINAYKNEMHKMQKIHSKSTYFQTHISSQK